MSEKNPSKPYEEELLAEAHGKAPETDDSDEAAAEAVTENPSEPGPQTPESFSEAAEDAPRAPTLEEQLATLKDQLMRQIAETENLRKRTEREREETARYAVTKFARDMLEISDNLERALQACEADKDTLPEAGKSLLEGVVLTHKTLLATFERHHVQKLSPQGEKFDHNKHQAMFEVETDAQEPGTVLEVMQPGYILHDRLLRPAMVGVSKKKASES